MSLKVTITEAQDNTDNSYVVNKRYDIQNNQYGVWETKDKNMYFVPKGGAVYVDAIKNHIDSGQKYLLLRFKDAQGREIHVEFPRKDLTENGVMELLGYGVQVTKQDARALLTSIFNQEMTAPTESYHEKLGFHIFNDKLVFLGKKAEGIDSNYCGKLKIGKKGKLDIWKTLVQEEILGHVPMELALAVGGAGVVVDYLRRKVPLENLMLHAIGDSSTGKTTAALFMVSCGAATSYDDSLVLNFGDTPNAIMNSVQSSYTTLIDEGSLCRYNTNSLLFSLGLGKERKRLTKDLETRDAAYFSTAIVITSEKSLLNMADENSGLLVRNIEIQGVEWTKSAESADKIRAVIENNYGFLVPMIARKILRYEEENKGYIMKWFKKWVNRFCEDAKGKNYYNPLTERASKQYAIILVSAELIERVMKIEIQKEDIFNFLIEHSLVKDVNRANIGERALEFLLQYVEHHLSQFVTSLNDSFVPSNCLGRIDDKARKIRLKNGLISEKKLYITDIVFERILQEGSFPDKKVILGKWRDLGYLKSEKDRFLSDIQIADSMKVKGYIINIPNGSDGTDERETSKK